MPSIPVPAICRTNFMYRARHCGTKGEIQTSSSPGRIQPPIANPPVGAKLRYPGRRVICRSVINNEKLPICLGLRQQTVNCPAEKSRLVVSGHQHRNLRVWLWLTCPAGGFSDYDKRCSSRSTHSSGSENDGAVYLRANEGHLLASVVRHLGLSGKPHIIAGRTASW
jgi:hypothetical protein